MCVWCVNLLHVCCVRLCKYWRLVTFADIMIKHAHVYLVSWLCTYLLLLVVFFICMFYTRVTEHVSICMSTSLCVCGEAVCVLFSPLRYSLQLLRATEKTTYHRWLSGSSLLLFNPSQLWLPDGIDSHLVLSIFHPNYLFMNAYKIWQKTSEFAASLGCTVH